MCAKLGVVPDALERPMELFVMCFVDVQLKSHTNIKQNRLQVLFLMLARFYFQLHYYFVIERVVFLLDNMLDYKGLHYPPFYSQQLDSYSEIYGRQGRFECVRTL